MFTPSSDRVISDTMVTSSTRKALRSSGSRVRTRALRSIRVPLRSVEARKRSIIALTTSQATMEPASSRPMVIVLRRMRWPSRVSVQASVSKPQP